MNREYHKWWSPRLQRDMELLVFGHTGANVLLFPTRCGRFHEAEDLGLIAALRPKIEAGHLQVYCLESVDAETFYCFWAHPSGRIQRHVQYEEYVLNEVLPLVASKNPNPCTIVHGASLGAFHAVNIALRHPRLFRKIVAFSGRYDLTCAPDGFGNLLDGYYDTTVYYHTPLHYLPGLRDEHLLADVRRMHIVLTVGRDDPFRCSTEQLSRVLRSKAIEHELHVWDGRAHSARAWRKMAALYV